MGAFAAVMTGKGISAIAIIQVFGDKAENILKKIFKPAGTKPARRGATASQRATLKPGKILLGLITDGSEVIDQVTIGCEDENSFAINCHGNPLIVEMIMQLLRRCGAELITNEQLRTYILSAQKNINTITIEAKLSQLRAKTITGTKIIANQIDSGLSKKLAYWQKNIDTLSLDEISDQAEQILNNSQIAKLIIFGCTAVLAGPPNTGKSTLLNYLAGRQKAIVTDIKGTTRDWVSAQCQIGPVSIELIDTAGLDEKLVATPEDTIEKAAQQKSMEMLKKSDLVLLVLDISQSAEQLDKRVLEKIKEKKVLTVLNKSDLPVRFNADKLPENLSETVQISAKFGDGIENLCEKIRQICSVDNFDLKSPVCFTSRQEKLLKQLKLAKSKQQATSIITELLNGQLQV